MGSTREARTAGSTAATAATIRTRRTTAHRVGTSRGGNSVGAAGEQASEDGGKTRAGYAAEEADGDALKQELLEKLPTQGA
jgi:hypothetical protein